MTEDLVLIDVRQCPDCDEWFEESGEFGIIPHSLFEHPDSELARSVNELLKG